MMKKSIRGSTCLGHLKKFKTSLPRKEVLEGANNTLKPANTILVIDGLDECQEYLKSTQSYVDHCILKPWSDRQDMFITCISTSESDTLDGLGILSAISALCYEIDDMVCLEEIADQYQDHAGIGYLISNLGVMFSEKTEYKKSETCFATAKNCFEREHDHLGNAVACLNLAILHRLIGNDETARSWCDSAASLCHDISMRMTRDVHLPWKVLRRIADLFQEFGNYKRCQDILKIGVLYDISGADGAPTITLMKRLMALQLKEQNGEKIQGEELEDVASQLLEVLDQLCTGIGVKQGLPNADLITTAIILAKMYRDMNHIEEACVLLEKLEAKYLLVHGSTHCLYASLLYHVSRFNLGVGKAGEAETMLKKALEIFAYYFGKGHHMVASCKSLLGTCALLKGQYRDASTILTEALTLFKKINPRHPDVAEILLKFAFLFNEEGNFQSAKKTMQEALDIFHSACGEDSPKTASAYIEAAAFLQKVRESRASAADKVKTAIDIFLKLGLRHDHPDVMICRSLLGVLQLNMGSDEAEEQFTEVLQQVSLLEESFMVSKIISPESTNIFFQVKTSGGADGYSCFGSAVVSLVNLVSMKAGKERRAHLNTLLSFLQGQETAMPLFAVFGGQNYIFHKVWLPDRYVYCVLTDQGVNSDFTSLKPDGLKDPNVFLLSSSTSHGKKPCYLLFWKTPKVLEMREPSRVCSAFRESVNMLFLQPKFRKGYVDGQDFYMELALPTEPCAVPSLYYQIDYLPLLVEQELSVSHKDGNIDTAIHSSLISAVKPSTHVSYFLYRFSSQRQAEFVFDNLICSLGHSLALAKAEGVEIFNASAAQNGECFFILEPSNSSLSLVVDEESVLVKLRTVKEYESSCICSSVKSTLESTMDSLCCVVRVSFEQSLKLLCDDHDVTSGCNYIKESAKKPHSSGHSTETLELPGDVRSRELECDHLEGEPPADLLQNEVAEDIFIGQLGNKISTEVCLSLLECLLTSRHVSSEVQPSATGEMSSSTHSVYLDDEKQLTCNNSMLSSPGSMSSLNSYSTSPSNEVCPGFLLNSCIEAAEPCDETKDPNNCDSCMIGNTSVACAVCSELPLTLQEKLSNQFVGDDCARDSSAIRSNHECVSSGENNQDTETGDIVQLEDGTQLSKEEILILKSEVEFCQNQCHELRQQLGQLKEQFQQCEEEKQQLELELGRRSFLDDKQKRYEKAFLSPRAHANEHIKSCSASGASYDFSGMEGKLLGGAGLLQDSGFSLQQRLLEISNSLSDVELRQMKFLAKPRVNSFRLAKIREGFELFEELHANGVLSCMYVRELLEGIKRFDLLEKLNVPLLGDAERGSHTPNGQTKSDRTTESSIIPPSENSLDLLPENPSQNSSGDNLLQLQSSYEEGLAAAESHPVTELRETDTQYMPQLCHPTDGEFRDGVDSLHQNSIPKSDSKRKRRFLSAKSNDDVVRLITTAAERDSQEQIEWLQRELQGYEAENQILQAELKRTSLPRVEKDLPGGACSLPGTSTRSLPVTGQKPLDRITESTVIPLKDRNQDLLPARQQVGCDETLDGMHIQDNGGVSGIINKVGPVPPNMSCKNSVNSGSDMNSDSEDSSVHLHFPDSSNGVSFSNESSSATVSSSELSSAAESMRVESTSTSSCMAHSVCDSPPRVTSDQLSAARSCEGFIDTSSYSNPSSSEEEIVEMSNVCESGDMDRRENYAAKNEEIGQVSESSGDVSDGPAKPPHSEMKDAPSVAKDVVDCSPLPIPDRVQERVKPQHVPGLMQDVLPDGDISVEQNVSGVFSGTEKNTTVEQFVCDVSTQSMQWERLGARPRDRPVKMPPPPELSLIDLVPQEVTVASGLANAFLARHSQDQSLHESLCQGSAVKLLSEEASSQGASYMDGTKHLGELKVKAKQYVGDCQVPRPDVDSRWMLPPPVPGGEYGSYNAVGGFAYNTQLSGHVGPLPSYLTGGTSNFTSSSAFDSSNYNSFRSDFALGAREPYLPLYGQVDSGLNTSVPGDQRLRSGMTGSHLANGSLMGVAGPQLTPSVQGLQRYSGPSDNASTMASEREKANLAWKANSRQTSVGNMADVGSSGLPAPLIVRSSSGADNRHVSEAESRRTRHYDPTGRSNVLNTSGDRVVSGANRGVDNTHTEAALLSAGSRGTRLVASGNGNFNLEPVGAEASLISANTGGSMLNTDFGTDSVESTDNSLLALEQRVEEACALVERVLREREEREQFGREIERKEREIREQRARKKREREAREQEEASRWPQQQEAITGRSQWLCEHYQRHCRVRFPCCSYFYPCHRCHNNSKACKNEEAKACHATHLKCSFCQHEQEIGEDSGKCRSCGAEMSAYFCSICKHFTSVDKNPYHCEKCGICRIHKDKSFHCEVCNVCLDKRLEGKHKCRPDSGHDECCICLEDAFSGCQILPCSHKVHRECALAMIQNNIRTCPVCRHPLYQTSE